MDTKISLQVTKQELIHILNGLYYEQEKETDKEHIELIFNMINEITDLIK